MKRFDHDNIVKLLGVCTRREPAYAIMEFMLHGMHNVVSHLCSTVKSQSCCLFYEEMFFKIWSCIGDNVCLSVYSYYNTYLYVFACRIPSTNAI